ATQKLLNRGERLTELLKQPQFSPLQMEEQVVVIYAGTRGYLDDVDVREVTRYEADLLSYLRNEKQDLLTKIRTDKELSKDIEAGIKDALDAFGKTFA
ncbi:MAG: F0F1 ATP synthase subunit alpha, partial [Henriciella sp.]